MNTAMNFSQLQIERPLIKKFKLEGKGKENILSD